LELIVRNIARYPQFATSTPIHCQPAIRYLLPWREHIIYKQEPYCEILMWLHWRNQFLVVQVIRMTKYDYRLSNKLDTDLQKLRCRVNYHALRFTDPIQELAEKLIQWMREKSRYLIALHLRLLHPVTLIEPFVSLHLSFCSNFTCFSSLSSKYMNVDYFGPLIYQ